MFHKIFIKIYFTSRKENKNLFKKISNSFNEKTKIVAIFGKKTNHPSIFKSALKLDLYPYNLTNINYHDFIAKDFHDKHYIHGRQIIIFYNLNLEDIKIIKNTLKTYKFDEEFYVFFEDLY